MSAALTVYTHEKKAVKLRPQDFLQAGGEGSVYVQGDTCYKIYHQPDRLPPVGKVQELVALNMPNILRPLVWLYDVAGKPVGITMGYAADTHFLCQVANRGFRLREGLGAAEVVRIVERMRHTLEFIHSKGILVVDYNELNFLLSKDLKEVFHIDVASYQTPSFPATALMEAVRDHQIKGNKWHQGSDWFSFAVVAHTLYLGFHPYKGVHPKYKPAAWLSRMQDNVSVYHPGARPPPNAFDVSTVPTRHMEWFRNMFIKGTRDAAPSADAPAAITVEEVVEEGGDLVLEQQVTLPSKVRHIQAIEGTWYGIDDTSIWRNGVAWQHYSTATTRFVLTVRDGDPTVIHYNSTLSRLEFEGDPLTLPYSRFLVINGYLYTITNRQLVVWEFWRRNGQLRSAQKIAYNLDGEHARPMQGCVLQTMLDTQWLVVPVGQETRAIRIPAWRGMRVINVAVAWPWANAILEHKGNYLAQRVRLDGSEVKVQELGEAEDTTCELTRAGTGVYVSRLANQFSLFTDNKAKGIRGGSGLHGLVATGIGLVAAHNKTIYRLKLA